MSLPKLSPAILEILARPEHQKKAFVASPDMQAQINQYKAAQTNAGGADPGVDAQAAAAGQQPGGSPEQAVDPSTGQPQSAVTLEQVAQMLEQLAQLAQQDQQALLAAIQAIPQQIQAAGAAGKDGGKAKKPTPEEMMGAIQQLQQQVTQLMGGAGGAPAPAPAPGGDPNAGAAAGGAPAPGAAAPSPGGATPAGGDPSAGAPAAQ